MGKRHTDASQVPPPTPPAFIPSSDFFLFLASNPCLHVLLLSFPSSSNSSSLVPWPPIVPLPLPELASLPMPPQKIGDVDYQMGKRMADKGICRWRRIRRVATAADPGRAHSGGSRCRRWRAGVPAAMACSHQ